jgi:hypothetical protein
MTLDYCIFCFENFNTDIGTLLDINNNSFSHIIYLVKNKNFVINCNHNYHLACLVKYHSYKCNDICNFNCNLPCPLCTIPIKKSVLQEAFVEFNKLHSILAILKIKLEKLYREIKIYKFVLCCKKIFVTLNFNEIYKFNKLNILYDELWQIKTDLVKYIRNYIDFCQV